MYEIMTNGSYFSIFDFPTFILKMFIFDKYFSDLFGSKLSLYENYKTTQLFRHSEHVFFETAVSQLQKNIQ